jgi:hypothetical protein
MLLLLPALLACLTTDSGPCSDYCDYICECHAGEADYDCDSCYTVYAETDASLDDQCLSDLNELRSSDETNGTGCTDGEDTAG